MRKLFRWFAPRQFRYWRGEEIAMIFQEPLTALNPVMTIGDQIAEAVLRHRGIGRSAAWARVIETLQLVQMPDPERRARQYPHELSDGMRQRAMIAVSLACEPKIIIADQPTTALDVTIRTQILGLIADLQKRLGTGADPDHARPRRRRRGGRPRHRHVCRPQGRGGDRLRPVRQPDPPLYHLPLIMRDGIVFKDTMGQRSR